MKCPYCNNTIHDSKIDTTKGSTGLSTFSESLLANTLTTIVLGLIAFGLGRLYQETQDDKNKPPSLF